ncbi:hypothetical protein [Alkalicoccobacillus murimartini]|uniref:CHAD domain-containing protein n=1 Tax=Alkalicoccobacillus murimartini TaxID=171685 RepID=A0ABT9YDR0_9BACI|nr:hypothetical protein [Alkalicoccobacillus murimartini]MDQ0205983.1 hypothetical protein [Alkalicoccobacillus murimartini]
MLKSIQESAFIRFLTPSHKKPIDAHLLSDDTTSRLIADTERFLSKLVEKADGRNQKRNLRRKQKEWTIKLKIKYKSIRLQILDSKNSSSPVHKRITITVFRKYVKEENGVAALKEATIHFLKDGRSHVRSLKDSPNFRGVFYQLYRLDQAYVHGGKQVKTSLELLSNQEKQLSASYTDDIRLLVEEGKRYVETVKHFSVDIMIENRLIRIIQHVQKLQEDFHFLDFEQRHTVRRMLREDIPKLLNMFLSLSLKHQLEQKENVFVSLSKMELTLITYTQYLEEVRLEHMNHLIRLQSKRYGNHSE